MSNDTGLLMCEIGAEINREHHETRIEQIRLANRGIDKHKSKYGNEYFLWFPSNHWESLIADTSLFKLTWKQEFPTEINGVETYYGRLLNGNLRRN
jgi:hypothetical protein